MGRFHKVRVGDAELISVQDSWTAVPPTGFFNKTQESDWEQYAELLDGDGNIVLNFGCWVIVSGGKTILVDTGMGPRPMMLPLQEPAALPEVLAEAGAPASEIDIVAFTHLHFDHTGWNAPDVDGRPTPLFAKARHVIQQAEWDYWTGSEELREGAQYGTALEPVLEAGLIDFVEGEHALTEEVTTFPTPGHTPGHVSFVVQSGGERVYVIGDAAHHMVQLTETDWCPSADVDFGESTRSRRMLFDRIEAEDAQIASGHFLYPGLGRAARVNGKRVYRAA